MITVFWTSMKLYLNTLILEQRLLAKWFLYWISVFGVFVFGLKSNGIDYLNYFYLTSLYFIIATFLANYLFDFKESICKVSNLKSQFKWITIQTLLFFILGVIIAHFIPSSTGLESFIEKNRIMFPLFRLETSFTKIVDIAFQQFMIVGLVLVLKDRLKTKAEVIGVFTFVFFLLHVPLLIVFSWSGLLFILPSFLAGIIFSFLILSYKNGITLSIFVHEYFYLVLGIILRLYFL